MPWKPEVFVEGKWLQNQLVFATEKEAADNASDLYRRWTLCEGYRAVEVTDKVVNHSWVDGKLVIRP